MKNHIFIAIFIFQLAVSDARLDSPIVKFKIVPTVPVTTTISAVNKDVLFPIDTHNLTEGFEYCYHLKEPCTADQKCVTKIAQCHQGHSCFALWNETHLIMKGCYNKNKVCVASNCHAQPDISKFHFCCCTGMFCNNNMTFSDYLAPDKIPVHSSTPAVQQDSHMVYVLKVTFQSLVPIVICLLLSGYMLYLWRNKTVSHPPGHLMANAGDKQTMQEEDAYVDPPHLNLQLLDMIDSGHFGKVWRADCFDKIMAVKVFTDMNVWRKERDIYLLPKMSESDFILKFISAEKKNYVVDSEYWIITEYHSHGSLCDFLKKNTISWAEMMRMALSIAEGMQHLHSEQIKPCIVHRDIKSSNILVKADLTAVICDFGLAVTFTSTKDAKNSKMQVGTRRYMAPELLEGAIDFEYVDFFRIDIYAMALVYWELLTRCRGENGEVEDYRLPFTDEVGEHPTIAKMHEVIVFNKAKPKVPKHFLKDKKAEKYIIVMDNCLDYDCEGRLTASCVKSRLKKILLSQSEQAPSDISTGTSEADEKLPLLEEQVEADELDDDKRDGKVEEEEDDDVIICPGH